MKTSALAKRTINNIQQRQITLVKKLYSNSLRCKVSINTRIWIGFKHPRMSVSFTKRRWVTVTTPSSASRSTNRVASQSKISGIAILITCSTASIVLRRWTLLISILLVTENEHHEHIMFTMFSIDMFHWHNSCLVAQGKILLILFIHVQLKFSYKYS